MTSDPIHLPKNAARRLVLLMLMVIIIVITHFSADAASSDELQIHKCWEFRQDGVGSASADRKAVYFVRNSATVSAISADSGKMMWSSDVGGIIDSNLLVTDGNLIFIRRSASENIKNSDTVILQALSSTSGVTKWTSKVLGDSDFTLGISDDILVAISRNGTVQAFDPITGFPRWDRMVNGVGSSRSFIGTEELLLSQGNSIRLISLSGQEKTTIVNSSYEVSSLGPGTGESILWGDKRGNLIRYSTSSGKIIWQFKSGGAISNILVAGSRLFTTSDDNFVYALRADDGNRLWKRRVSGRVASVNVIGDQTLLVRPSDDDGIVLLDVVSGKITGQITMGTDEVSINVLVIKEGTFAIISGRAISAFSIGGCGYNK